MAAGGEAPDADAVRVDTELRRHAPEHNAGALAHRRVPPGDDISVRAGSSERMRKYQIDSAISQIRTLVIHCEMNIAAARANHDSRRHLVLGRNVDSEIRLVDIGIALCPGRAVWPQQDRLGSLGEQAQGASSKKTPKERFSITIL